MTKASRLQAATKGRASCRSAAPNLLQVQVDGVERFRTHDVVVGVGSQEDPVAGLESLGLVCLDVRMEQPQMLAKAQRRTALICAALLPPKPLQDDRHDFEGGGSD